MDKTEKKKRIKGVLVGCACGDAMGMPTEMLSREKISDIFPEGICTFNNSTEQDIFERKMQAGEITDDTINTILITQMLIDAEGKIDTLLYLNYLREWMKKNPDKNQYVAGPSTMRALDWIKKGMPLERAGLLGTTNGSSMKISPIGIISDYHDIKALADNVEKICMPTHNTGIAIAGACVVAACVSYGIQGGTKLKELWDIALLASETGNQRGYAFPTASLTERIQAVKKLMEHENKNTVLKHIQYFYGTGVETIETIPAVLAIIQMADGNPWKAACISAEIGGDTDTLGAISAAICGSMFPEFPNGVTNILEKVNQLDFDILAENLLPYAI